MYKFVNLENGEEIMAYNTAIVYSNGINTPKTDQVIVALKMAAMIFNMLPNSIERIKQGQGDIVKNTLADGVKYRLDCLSGLTITVNDVRNEILGCCNDIGSLPKYIAYLGTEFERTKIPADIEELMDPRNEAYTDLWSIGMNDVAAELTLIATQCWQWVEGVKDIIAELRQTVDGRGKPQQGEMPKELNTPEAKMYFAKAIELGLMDDSNNWLKGLQMLACFAREMSIKLKLGKGERISWKPFETLFDVPTGKLRLNYNDIQKVGQDPIESYLIDKVFE